MVLQITYNQQLCALFPFEVLRHLSKFRSHLVSDPYTHYSVPADNSPYTSTISYIDLSAHAYGRDKWKLHAPGRERCRRSMTAVAATSGGEKRPRRWPSMTRLVKKQRGKFYICIYNCISKIGICECIL